MPKPHCSVGFSGADHFPKGGTWYITWMPKGYAPSSDMKMVCAIPDQGWANTYSVARDEGWPPLVAAIVQAIEAHYAEQSC